MTIRTINSRLRTTARSFRSAARSLQTAAPDPPTVARRGQPTSRDSRPTSRRFRPIARDLRPPARDSNTVAPTSLVIGRKELPTIRSSIPTESWGQAFESPVLATSPLLGAIKDARPQPHRFLIPCLWPPELFPVRESLGASRYKRLVDATQIIGARRLVDHGWDVCRAYLDGYTGEPTVEARQAFAAEVERAVAFL